MLENLPLLFLPPWAIIILIIIGIILIGVFILKKLIKIAFVVAIIILIIIGVRVVFFG